MPYSQGRLGPRDLSQIASFCATNSFADRLTSAFALMTDWSFALTGALRLEDVVRTLGHQVGAAHIALYRIERPDETLRPILTVDRRSPPAPSALPRTCCISRLAIVRRRSPPARSCG